MDRLYDRYASPVLGLALRITGNRATSEEVVQETFLGIWRNARTFDPVRGSARTWIMTLAHHRAVDAVRRRRMSTPLLDEEDREPAGMPVSPGVWPEVHTRLAGRAVHEALESLSAVQRQAIELAYFAGRTHVEIATITATPLGTVKSRVRLGLLRLRDALEGTDADRTMTGGPLASH